MTIELPRGSELADAWGLDPAVVFLNHGSFGACPRAVLERQSELRAQMESEPVRFFVRELPGLLDAARTELGRFVGADPEGLAFITNATTGVNTALAAVPLAAGDEVLVTDHGYAACKNAVAAAARRAGARVVEAVVPFPLAAADDVVEAVLAASGPRTRAAVIDHVTSPTALVWPIERLASELERRGIAVIVDGAHAPGMVELDVDRIGASFYTGNCHKWLCAPKGAAFLWVRADRRGATHPLVTSHGATARLGDRSRFRLEFDWTGTGDPTPWLSVPTAISVVGGMLDGGWAGVRARNRALALAARSRMCTALGIDPPCPDRMIGSMAAVPSPPLPGPAVPGKADPLQEHLLAARSIEVPVTTWATPPRRALRVSTQLYTSRDQIRYLAAALDGFRRSRA